MISSPLILSLICILSFFTTSFSFFNNIPAIKHTCRTSFAMCADAKDMKGKNGYSEEGGKWYSNLYSKSQLDEWWVNVDRPLITIGSKGVTVSHINSLNELVGHHGWVRIKLASDTMDPNKISEEIANSEVLKSGIELLQIRKREIMFGKTGK